MRKPRFSLTEMDPEVVALVDRTDHRALGVWARECAARVLPFFEDAHPDDPRPRAALETLDAWVESGEFSMATIRKASLDAHAAAREVGENDPARSAARAAGQAVATAHVPRHALGAAIYAVQAIHRASDPEQLADAVAAERAWQRGRLRELSAR
jgi:hypothetical protein